MNDRYGWAPLLIVCLLLAFIPGCVTKPNSCDKVKGICLELTFDGQSCLYEGPKNMKTEPVTIIFLNESDVVAAANLLRIRGDKTLQDLIDYIGEEPSTQHHPFWSREVSGVWEYVDPGDSHTWKGVLESGGYALVCARITPLGVWLGDGFTVEE
jgi:hypothetical protein